MTALAQGAAGVALVMALALLGVRRVSAATVLLGVQSLAVAVAALVEQQPILAALTLLANGAVALWVLRRDVPAFHPSAPQVGGTRLGLLAGMALAVLSQTRDLMAEPMAVVLLSTLLAATRRHALMHLVALVSLQNGLSLAASAGQVGPLAALPGFLVALPLCVALSSGASRAAPPAWRDRIAGLLGWAQVAIAALLLCGSLAAPLDPIGALFVPLVAGWGLACAWSQRMRRRRLGDRVAALVALGAALAAAAAPVPLAAVLALGAAMAATLFPAARRRVDALLLGSCATGLALFGLLAAGADQSVVPIGSLLLGIVTIAAIVPDLSPVCGIILLRLSQHGPWPPAAATMLAGGAALGLVACAVGILLAPPRHRMALLRLAGLLLVGAALGIATAEGRFAAAVLLILAILSDAAVRLSWRAGGMARAASVAALAGLPPVGIFGGLVLLIQAAAAAAPWMLAPVSLALAAMIRAALPRRLPTFGRPRLPSPAWVPLGLALALGYAAPDRFIGWLRAVTMSTP